MVLEDDAGNVRRIVCPFLFCGVQVDNTAKVRHSLEENTPGVDASCHASKMFFWLKILKQFSKTAMFGLRTCCIHSRLAFLVTQKLKKQLWEIYRTRYPST